MRCKSSLGRQTLVLHVRSERGGQRDNPGLPFPPPLIYVLLLILGFLVERAWPTSIVALSAIVIVRALGALLIIVAALVAGSAVGAFRFAKTPVIPVRPTTALVLIGPYRFTRNPIYLGMLLASAGIALMSNALWPLLMTPVMVLVVNQVVIAREERYLTAKFGGAYTAYKSRVRRWI